MTSQAQSRHLRLWYKSIPKPLRSRWLIGLLLAGGLTGIGFEIYRAIAPSENVGLITATVQQKSLPITLSANGTIKPQRIINLSPKSSGYLKKLLVKEGDLVEAGQIVAYMDDSNLQG